MSEAAARMIVMTHTTGTVHENAADIAERLLTHDDAELDRPLTILTHAEGSSLMQRRAALRPVYEAIVARIGQPTLLGGTTHGPEPTGTVAVADRVTVSRAVTVPEPKFVT
jgi:hypothetical protein